MFFGRERERISEPFVVCHVAPEVRVKVASGIGGKMSVEATAVSPLVRLTGVLHSSPLAPEYGREGRGVRGTQYKAPPAPNPSPPSGEGRNAVPAPPQTIRSERSEAASAPHEARAQR